jgi:hypothetical protein
MIDGQGHSLPSHHEFSHHIQEVSDKVYTLIVVLVQEKILCARYLNKLCASITDPYFIAY